MNKIVSTLHFQKTTWFYFQTYPTVNFIEKKIHLVLVS